MTLRDCGTVVMSWASLAPPPGLYIEQRGRTFGDDARVSCVLTTRKAHPLKSVAKPVAHVTCNDQHKA